MSNHLPDTYLYKGNSVLYNSEKYTYIDLIHDIGKHLNKNQVLMFISNDNTNWFKNINAYSFFVLHRNRDKLVIRISPRVDYFDSLGNNKYYENKFFYKFYIVKMER